MRPRRYTVKKSPLMRFLAKVDTTGACWIWLGAVNNRGYGVLQTAIGLSSPIGSPTSTSSLRLGTNRVSFTNATSRGV